MCTTLGLAKYAICIVHKNSKTNFETFDFRLFRYEGKIGQLLFKFRIVKSF